MVPYRRVTRISLLNLTLLAATCLIGSCERSGAYSKIETDVQSDTKMTVDSKEAMFLKWSAVELPILVSKLAKKGEEIFAVSEDEIFLISSEINVSKMPPVKIANAKISADGGFTGKALKYKTTSGRKDANGLRLCSPESALFMSGSLYVYAICEHSSQLWKVRFEKESSNLDVIGLTYRTGPEDGILGPHGLPSESDKVFLPARLDSGPVLLTDDPKTARLEVSWRGEEQFGEIVSLDFVGEYGWMVFNSGKIFNTHDEGQHWRHIADLPRVAKNRIAHLKFRNQKEGLIVGEGLVLSTEDD